MSLPPAQLIGYFSHVDCPHHDAVLSLVKSAILLPKGIRPLAETVISLIPPRIWGMTVSAITDRRIFLATAEIC